MPLPNVMIRALCVLPLLLVAACSTQRESGGPREAQPIFRHVDLGVLGRFALGEPFGAHARLAVAEGPNTYRLRDAAFGGAASIVVTTDDAGRVRRISFEYGPAYDYATKLSNYTASLGRPAHSTGDEAVWSDGLTEFRLSREPNTTYAARAEMRDVTPSRQVRHHAPRQRTASGA